MRYGCYQFVLLLILNGMAPLMVGLENQRGIFSVVDDLFLVDVLLGLVDVVLVQGI